MNQTLQIDEVRIYSRALTPDEVQILAGTLHLAVNPNGTMRFSTDRIVGVETMSPDIRITNFQLRWQNFTGTFDTTMGTCVGCVFDAQGTCQAEVEKIWGMFNTYNITINLTPDRNISMQDLQMCCRDLNTTVGLNSNCSNLTNYGPSTYSDNTCFTPVSVPGYSYNTSNTVCIYLHNITTSGVQIPIGTITPTPKCEQIACEINGTWNTSNTKTFTINKTITVTAIN
ncbi:MAG: hypothetical protein QW666_00900 [Candidatus Woesearchaeota archaeon]